MYWQNNEIDEDCFLKVYQITLGNFVKKVNRSASLPDSQGLEGDTCIIWRQTSVTENYKLFCFMHGSFISIQV
jgi:hypothetical protein